MIMRLALLVRSGQWRLLSVNTASAHWAAGAADYLFLHYLYPVCGAGLGSIAKATGFSIFKFIRYILKNC